MSTMSPSRKDLSRDCHMAMERSTPLDVIDMNVPSSSVTPADEVGEAHILTARRKDSVRSKNRSKGKEGREGGSTKSVESTDSKSLRSFGPEHGRVAGGSGFGTVAGAAIRVSTNGISTAGKSGRCKGTRIVPPGPGTRSTGPAVPGTTQALHEVSILPGLPSFEKEGRRSLNSDSSATEERGGGGGSANEERGGGVEHSEKRQESSSGRDAKQLQEEVRQLHSLTNLLECMREEAVTALNKERERLRCARQEIDQLKAELEDAKKEIGMLRERNYCAVETGRSRTEFDVSHPSWISVIEYERSEAERMAEQVKIWKALESFNEHIDKDQRVLVERMKTAIANAEALGIAVSEDARADLASLERDVELQGMLLRSDDDAARESSCFANLCSEEECDLLLLQDCGPLSTTQQMQKRQK
ncbi:hypothetical protein CBR_g22492 [Chara braunii]|uniref:Uncharacterized protein n=1 Tax=Chara braunii TaxID=69332 RepID=A0A388L340_CHABU|nr:hypothetical protein CBR_g22492 [Chara braunii]|eukprot:GBG76613.1 hypothetical protein CBR_g22492 [Chara braunii]